MNEELARRISRISTLGDLSQFEKNAKRLGALTQEVSAALDARSADLGREVIAKRTGLQVTDLTPAEEKIIQAVSIYVGIKHRAGRNANRTLRQLKNQGIIGAAEIAVTKAKPTDGYMTLLAEHRSDLSYEQIIVDHPSQFSERAHWFARRTLGLANASEAPPAPEFIPAPSRRTSREAQNPLWTREEHILALDLYLRLRGTSYGDETPEVITLSETLQKLAKLRAMSGGPTFRNPNGVSMKMMNFRRIDPLYTADGRVGLGRGSSVEEKVWAEFIDDPASLALAVETIMASVLGGEDPGVAPDRYWVLVCNPRKWAVDRFLASGISETTWGVRPSDAPFFAPGQLAILRVGVDNRSAVERVGAARLKSGIYALCEVESVAFPNTGTNDGFWAEGAGRDPGWPTIRVRYLRVYTEEPLTIERLRRESTDLSPLLLRGFQAASFPIGAKDFHVVMALLGEDLDNMTSPPSDMASSLDQLADLEARFINASPEVKTRVSKRVERGPIGAAVKRANGHKCQLCETLGADAVGFRKKDGTPYVEAHHVMPVSTKKVGVLSCTNIMTLCANHHRQMHYGDVIVAIEEMSFEVTLGGKALTIPKIILPAKEIKTLAA